MGIFDKTCPQCMAVSPARSPRCVCGYAFDPRDEEDRTLTPELIARQEILFQEYLEARAEQATEAAKVATRAAELDPENRRKAIEAIRARHAAGVAEAQLDAQRRRAREAARVAGVEWYRSARMRPPSPPASLATPVVTPVTHRASDSQTSRSPFPTVAPAAMRHSARDARSLAVATQASAAPAGVAKNGGLPVAKAPAPAGSRLNNGPVALNPLRGRAPVGNARPARARRVALHRISLKSLQKAVTGTVVIAAKTTKTVARAAKTVVGAAAQTATKAVKAAQKKRLARTAARPTNDVPVLREVVTAPAAPAKHALPARAPANTPALATPAPAPKPVRSVTERRAPRARAAAFTAAEAVAKPAAAGSQPQRQAPPPLATAPLTDPEQHSVPSETLRAVKARKIARAVEAARTLVLSTPTSECPLCTAQLPQEATSCRCGWRVSDLPSLESPAEMPVPAKLPSVEAPQQCPSCTAVIAPDARRCKCGWVVPGGASELLPVTLSPDERTALSLGLQIEHPKSA